MHGFGPLGGGTMDTMHAFVTATRVLAVLASLFMAGSLTATPAVHADDAGYLARLNASGVPIPVPDNVRLTSGRYICGELRNRASDAEVVRQMTNTFFYSPAAAQVQIDAARAELCPDAPPPH